MSFLKSIEMDKFRKMRECQCDTKGMIILHLNT